MFYVMKIDTIKDFEKCLSSIGYTQSGCYPIYFITDSGRCLSFKTAARERERIKDAIYFGNRNGWRVTACDVNWGNDVFCSHSGERIESVFDEQDNG